MSEFTVKVTVLEMIIACLVEHEQRLADITQHLENIIYLLDVNRLGVEYEG